MKNTFALMATLSALTLTACGGGGGSDSPVSVNPQTNGGNNVVPLSYDYAIFENGERVDENNSEPTYPQNRLNIMNLDGRNLEILPTGVTGSIVSLEDKSKGIRKTVGGNLSYARYGIISYDKEKKDYVFYQSIASETSIIPKTGTATYKGYAVAIRPSDREISKGTSSFNVDFDKKTLTGEIKTEKFGNFVFNQGEIHKYNNFSLKGDKNLLGTGEFAGKNAEEITGYFSQKEDRSYNPSKNDIYGTFGAKKQ